MEQITFGFQFHYFASLAFWNVLPVNDCSRQKFFPEHLTGRCVTLLNMFAIGGAGLFQFLSGKIFAFKLETEGSV